MGGHKREGSGDQIIEMGRAGESMFIMVSGTAGVYACEPDRQVSQPEEADRQAAEQTRHTDFDK